LESSSKKTTEGDRFDVSLFVNGLALGSPRPYLLFEVGGGGGKGRVWAKRDVPGGGGDRELGWEEMRGGVGGRV